MNARHEAGSKQHVTSVWPDKQHAARRVADNATAYAMPIEFQFSTSTNLTANNVI